MSDPIQTRILSSVYSHAERNALDIGKLLEAENGDMQLFDDTSIKIIGGLDRSQFLDRVKLIFKFQAAIDAKRAEFPGFGAPTTSARPGAGNGFFRHFENGSIFWTPDFGAHAIYGAIRDKYASLGWEKSYLGYPTTDELGNTHAGKETRYNNFDRGSIFWTATEGAFIPLALNARIERHQLGAWVHLSGSGFTPGGRINFVVDGLTNAPAPKSIGMIVFARGDGTFDDAVWDGRTWDPGGDAQLRATDAVTGRSISRPVPPLY